MIKWVFDVLGVVLLIVILGIGGLWIKYLSVVSSTPQEVPDNIKTKFPLVSKVNPFIGTGGVPWTCAHNFPGASAPFGVVRLSPETSSFINDATALNTSGYYYGDDKLLGFSHTRLVGTGATDGGHFLVLPFSDSDLENGPPEKYLKFSHKNELAYPGYYGLGLPKDGIHVELTSTERVGLHRYHFSDSERPGLLFNVTHALGNKRSEQGYLNIKNEKEMEGHVRTFGSFGGRYGGIKVYFAARFSQPIEEIRAWKDDIEINGMESAQGDELQFLLLFDQPEIELRLAISHVSIENAWENLEKETKGMMFDQVVEQTAQKWENRLSRITVSGGTSDQQAIFYTALYRSFQMPTIFSDVNGQYKGFDKQVHQADSFTYFTDMSIWDTFRTVHPLYNLIARQDQKEMVISLTKMAEQGGWLPRWPSGYGYTNSMLGTASDIVISEAYQKGVRDFDVDFAYQNMKTIALEPMPPGSPFSGREGNESCRLYGYCPADSMREAVSRTLEFAWSDYSISLLAKALGKDAEAQQFLDLSMHYKNTWNPETQFFQPKNANGEFDERFKPLLLTYVDGDKTYTNDYVEGSAMQWRWAPFFDGAGLIKLFESKDYFVDELNTFFEEADQNIGHWYPGSFYWHGNEPDIHSAYFFNDADRPDLTQKWVRWIMESKYLNRYDGLDGNDDAATLSAWFVWNALGLYPIAGTDIYHLGAPLFREATINLGTEKLSITTKNYDPDNLYVNEIRLNGTPITRKWITHQEIEKGGEIVFVMSGEPKETN